MNLEKRIKRNIIGRQHDFFAVTLPGHEQLSAGPLEKLSDTINVTKIVHGGICFNGRLTDLYLASLYLRTTTRILMRLVRFKASNFNLLASHTRKIAWELYLPFGAIPNVNVTAHHSRLYHTRAVAEQIECSITTRWSKLAANTFQTKDQTLFVRLQDDHVTVSLDSSGAPLYQRGIKTHGARAPLRETIAAAILMISGYRPDRPIIDPMCGSGTFSLEAALMANNIPPGYYRDFAFMQWPSFKPQQWSNMKKKAGQKIKHPKAPLIIASDSDEKVCARLQKCIHQNKLEDSIMIFNMDFFNMQPQNIIKQHQPGVIVLNPPYGKRLFTKDGKEKWYKNMAAKLKKDFKGWQAALLIPTPGLTKKLNLSMKSSTIRHGGLKLTLMVGTI